MHRGFGAHLGFQFGGGVLDGPSLDIRRNITPNIGHEKALISGKWVVDIHSKDQFDGMRCSILIGKIYLI
jgi:hypothetical protein